MTNAFPTILQVYGLVGTADRVSADVFDFPHNYNRTSRDAVYAFLGKWFLGVDDVASTREGEIKVETPEDLYTFTTENPYPPTRRNPTSSRPTSSASSAAWSTAMPPGPIRRPGRRTEPSWRRR